MSKHSSPDFWMQGLPIIVGIIGIFYTIYAIRKEDKNYLKDALDYFFQGYRLKVPQWWTKTSQTDSEIIFERTDTRYEWYARFEFIENDDSDLTSKFQEIVENKKILFDEHHSVIHNSEKFENFLNKNPDHEIARIESTATENHIKRLYYDVCLIKDKKNKTFLLCESRSSVLNGLVEGPFFEKLLYNLEFKNKKHLKTD